MEDTIIGLSKGLITDVSPINQPKESYRFALNAINETIEGDSTFLSMENAISQCTTLPVGATIIGKCYMSDDTIALLLADGTLSYIGILDKFNNYSTTVQTSELGFLPTMSANMTFRLRRSNNRIIYWTIDNSPIRMFNFDRESDFYSIDYKDHLKALNPPDDFVGEKWEAIHFSLIKKYEKIPSFTKAEVVEGGNIPSGSYSIAIQLVDANFNSTEWITTSNPVNIYCDTLQSNYTSIRGSRNSFSDAQRYPNASKSIKWTLDNLDENFSYYRVAVLVANLGDGNVNQALVSQLQTIDNKTFTFSGNLTAFTETPVTDIYQQQADIASAKYIEQLENRLIIAGIKGTQINWCDFQRFASKIKSDFVYKFAETQNIKSSGNAKCPITPFADVGNMWGEVAAFGIVYTIEGGIESPVFHIPGRPEDEDNGMQFYECDASTKYVNTSICSDFWGQDYWGNNLRDTQVRHHRFPERTTPVVGVFDLITVLAGIKFSNIHKPHPSVIGYKIVRAEKTDDDKLVVDNAIMGAMKFDPTNPASTYHAFGLLSPDTADTNKSKKCAYIFSPEHQFLNKPLIFDEIKVIGRYNWSNEYVPSTETVNKTEGSGAYVNDVSAGTSYNPEFHTTPDPDGFDLQIMYRSTAFSYQAGDGGITIPQFTHIHTLAGAGNIMSNGRNIFNASSDNKITVVEFANTELSANTFTANSKNRLLYVSLRKTNSSAYSDFTTRKYYKEHNNLFLFNPDDDNDIQETTDLFNGDCYTTPATIVSTTYTDTHFADRDKKSKVWKIVLGAVLVVAAIVVNVIPGVGQAVSAGLGTLAASVLTAATVAAISYGISMITSGVEFETLKNMIDTHYEAGLKECISDEANVYVKNEAGEVTESKYLSAYDGAPKDDDRFLWFADRLQNIYFDSTINMGLRSGLTIGLSDFINSPSVQLSGYSFDKSSTATRESFETYLINKLTVIDREQGDGRLYLGYPTSEFYDINLDYLKKNKEKIYNFIPLEYDCCARERETFKSRVHYSEQSYQEELLDNYRVFLPNNYRDVESQTGKITNIFRYNNSLYIHTAEGLFHLPQNLQEQVTKELVTFIGTGAFFAIPPRKIYDSGTAVSGSVHNQATQVTKAGVFFVSEVEKKVYLFSDGPKDLTIGNRKLFQKNLTNYLNRAIESNIGKIFVPDSDNAYSKKGIGIHSVYDEKNERILFTKIDYRPLKPFSLFTGSNPVGSFVYKPNTLSFGLINSSGQFVGIEYSNKTYFQNKSWTMSYSLTSSNWVSYHSYLPRTYIGTPNFLYSSDGISNKVYLHNVKEMFCNFYGTKYPFIVELVSLSNPLITRMWNHIGIHALVKRYNEEYDGLINDTQHFFDIMIVNNERQLSAPIHLKIKTEKEFPEDYLSQQIEDVNHEGIVNYVEGTWYINDFRDFISSLEQPMFSQLWDDIKDEYPIDKVINQNVLNLEKDWTEQEVFRGKYLSIRLMYYGENDNNDIQITVNYVLSNEQPSIR